MNLSYNYNIGRRPPLEILQNLGITFSAYHFDKKTSVFFLFDCENVPVELPEYLKIEKGTPFLNRQQRRKYAKENRRWIVRLETI